MPQKVRPKEDQLCPPRKRVSSDSFLRFLRLQNPKEPFGFLFFLIDQFEGTEGFQNEIIAGFNRAVPLDFLDHRHRHIRLLAFQAGEVGIMLEDHPKEAGVILLIEAEVEPEEIIVMHALGTRDFR
jgi:hypothetical protein